MCARTLIAIPRKSTLRSIISYSLRDRGLKHDSFVLGSSTKLLINPIFDLGDN